MAKKIYGIISGIVGLVVCIGAGILSYDFIIHALIPYYYDIEMITMPFTGQTYVPVDDMRTFVIIIVVLVLFGLLILGGFISSIGTIYQAITDHDDQETMATTEAE